MSIAVLTQVYSEARRLAIAGSIVARGDFRLKKLLPPLEQAGKQTPVFAKIAEAATAVVEGPEESSAAALLELTSLVNAVLYTQGETGLPGKLEPIESTDLGGSVVQTSARVLKPLLEALSSTGSGRLELVKDAHDRGLFRDLRLVKPALGALDDPYPEVAELIAEKVLPMYGKAILSELRAKYDPKGTKGHPRRLKLMHLLDPAGSRDLVKAALEGGGKEVKVAAISCLGAETEDLAFLVEQASAKAQDVRAAAYKALVGVDADEAVAVLAKALTGKDFSLAADAIEEAKHPKFVDVLAAEIRTSIDGLPKQKDKKAVGTAIHRLVHLMGSLPKGDFASADALLLDLFARRAELAKLKGEMFSGSDLVEAVIRAMEHGSKATQAKLVAAHAELTPDELQHAVRAGRECLTPTQFFDTFSPYLAAKVDEKKKGKDPAWARREAVVGGFETHYSFYHWYSDEDNPFRPKLPPFDPRWLDLAVKAKQLDLVNALARPDHAGALEFAKAEFDAALTKAKSPDELTHTLSVLLRLKHPSTTDAYFAALGKRNKKTAFYHHYWFASIVPRLSKDALTRLEELVAGMPDSESKHWLDAIQELRTKP